MKIRPAVHLNEAEYKELADALTMLQLMAKNTKMFDKFALVNLSAEETFRYILDIIDCETILDD